jgi:hypothetical protein
MRLPGQSDKPGNPDSQIIPELILFASIIAQNKKKTPISRGLSRTFFITYSSRT